LDYDIVTNFKAKPRISLELADNVKMKMLPGTQTEALPNIKLQP
jgi:hypothetical protein